jgi:hypothetical protein
VSFTNFLFTIFVPNSSIVSLLSFASNSINKLPFASLVIIFPTLFAISKKASIILFPINIVFISCFGISASPITSKSNLDDATSEFVYAGRNKAKYIVDCYADKTTQFSQGQKINTVLSEIASKFDLEVIGDAEMPKQDMKTILIGNKIIDAFLEIANSVGKIITSDAKGNLLIEFEAKDKSETILEFGTNIVKRKFVNDTTKVFDKYVTVAQSNYLAEQTQDVFIKGVYGEGKFVKTKVLQNCLTAQECENISKIQYKKDMRKSYTYTATINTVEIDVNTQYFVNIFKIVCFAKNVLVKSTKSDITLLLASAQYDVNSKLLLVFLLLFLVCCCSFI